MGGRDVIRNKRRWRKGEMAKTIVIYCIRTLTGVLIWAVVLKTLCAVLNWTCDLSDVLTFAGAFFGGELALLAFKRVFAKDKNNEEEN